MGDQFKISLKMNFFLYFLWPLIKAHSIILRSCRSSIFASFFQTKVKTFFRHFLKIQAEKRCNYLPFLLKISPKMFFLIQSQTSKFFKKFPYIRTFFKKVKCMSSAFRNVSSGLFSCGAYIFMFCFI